MKENIWQKKIPTLLGMLFIGIGVGLTSLIIQQETSFFGFASISDTPENIRLSNITDNSFTVSYTTSSKTVGSVNFGTTESLGSSALDQDDIGKEITARTVHLIPVSDLKPSTTYYFSIISGGTTFLNNGKPFSITTGPIIDSKDSGLEGKGTVIFDDPTINEAILYITNDKMQQLATKVNADGSYVFSQKTRTKDLASYLKIEENEIMRILISASTKQSNISIFAKDLKNIPSVILSNNYDFTISSAPVATTSAIFGFPSLIASPSANQTPQIVIPRKNEEFIDTRPVFRGTASPSAEVNIEIHSDENIKTSIVADSKGNWTYRPPTNLSSGPHTINISTRDAFGIIKTITQSFTVYAQGSQVSQNATPSATLVPSQIPTTTPVVPTPTIISSSPTVIITPTETPALTSPTLNPNPTLMQQPGDESVIVFGTIAFVATMLGTIIVLLSFGIL